MSGEENPTYEDYKLEYRYIEGKWDLSAEPVGNGAFASMYDIQAYDASFDETKIYWSPTTSLTVNTDNRNGDPLVINGRDADDRPEGEDVDLSGVAIFCGNVTLNCPVDTVFVPERQYGTKEPMELVINGTVDELTFSLMDRNSRIVLGPDGSVGGGTWNRPFGYNRTFGTSNGPATGTKALFEDCTLNEFSAREGQGLQALIPAESTLKEELSGLSEDDHVLMDVNETSMEEADEEALVTIGIDPDNIATAFDISVYSYTVAADGKPEEGEVQSELDGAVPIAVTDPAAGNDPDAYVVRLHENTAEALATTCSNGVYTFESDLFSKYFLVRSTTEEHNLTAHPAVAATCTTAGNTAYWSCDMCGGFFSDAEGTLPIEENSWVIEALGHDDPLAHTEAAAATCTTEGNTEYWYCSRCGNYFSDATTEHEIALIDTVIAVIDRISERILAGIKR